MFCLEELTSSLNAAPASEDGTMQVQNAPPQAASQILKMRQEYFKPLDKHTYHRIIFPSKFKYSTAYMYSCLRSVIQHAAMVPG